MKISPQWLREFVDYKVPLRQLADELTHTGTAVESISGQGESTVFETEITTNRVDAMNHYGVAREISAIYDLDLKPIAPKLPKAKPGGKFPISIEEPELCARYTARVMRGVKIRPSPDAVKRRLALLDSSSISNAVDASNYTLLEMGHPTHAFDLDLLEGGKIIVRKARAGESVKTLDGVERKLTPDDLVIADAKRPVALAGIMGGFDTMITERTKNVLIESAWFEPATVRRTARRLGMHTDASHRFERGADWAATPVACARVAQLILEWAGGELVGPESDCVARKLKRPALELSRSELLRILGQEVPAADVERILRRLGFVLEPDRTSKERRNDYIVHPPTWRLDVEREIDLIEEVARVFGFDNFKNTLPSFSGAVRELPDAEKDPRVRGTLLGTGYDEAISMTFISANDAKRFSSAEAVPLANPLSEETAVMRNSLLPGMLDSLAHNLNRGQGNVQLFEAGNVFELNGAKTTERKQLAIGATGNAVEAGPHQPSRSYSFFDVKGAVEQLFENFEHSSIYFDEHAGVEYLHPGRSARAVMDGETVARLGQIAPEVAQARKIKAEVFVAEVFLDRLYQRALRVPRYQPLSRYPSVERDFSFIFPGEVNFQRIESAIRGLNIVELQDVEPVDMLRGKEAEKAGVAPGKYSMLLRADFQSSERTLREEEIAGWSKQIIAAFQKLGGALRSS